VFVNQTPGPYLTVTGSSAEAGDDGQVGRGNGFGGLITPMRPQSGEAPAGKNPVSHVGKTYHAVADDAARRILDETEAEDVTVELVSRIGTPITRPQAAHVAVSGRVDRARVHDILQDCLDDWAAVRDRLLAGHYELF
jgi:S-adenosylmethionine synthetase